MPDRVRARKPNPNRGEVECGCCQGVGVISEDIPGDPLHADLVTCPLCLGEGVEQGWGNVDRGDLYGTRVETRSPRTGLPLDDDNWLIRMWRS